MKRCCINVKILNQFCAISRDPLILANSMPNKKLKFTQIT